MTTNDAPPMVTGDGHTPPHDAAAQTGQLPHPPIRPLLAVGVVVTKAALIDALRFYVAELIDVEPIEGERFFLRTAPDGDRLPGGR